MADKKDFLRRLSDCLAASEAQCLAWAMMSNHYHLLIRAGSQPLSRLMGPLLGGFGGSYNRRHGRVGYVFQNRFKSILCEEDSYLLGVIRYIHLNPVRANLVSNLQMLDHYPWTGHAGIVGKSRYSWHAADEVLRLFGETRRQARANNLSIAKSLICYWGTEELGLTMLEIGLKMGMSQQAISKWVKKGRDYCRSENIDIDSLLR